MVDLLLQDVLPEFLHFFNVWWFLNFDGLLSQFPIEPFSIFSEHLVLSVLLASFDVMSQLLCLTLYFLLEVFFEDYRLLFCSYFMPLLDGFELPFGFFTGVSLMFSLMIDRSPLSWSIFISGAFVAMLVFHFQPFYWLFVLKVLPC